MNPFVRFIKTLRANPVINRSARWILKPIARNGKGIHNLITTHLTISGVVKVKLADGQVVRFYSKSDDSIPTLVYWHGLKGYEPETVAVFIKLISGVSTFIDIGANIGYYAILAKAFKDDIEMKVFEPVPWVAERLKHNLALNQINDSVIEVVALSDKNGTAKMFTGTGQKMTLASSLDRGWIDEGIEIEVPVSTLDAWLESKPGFKPELIKLDVELHGPAVLRGMKQTLATKQPVLIAELLFYAHDREVEAEISAAITNLQQQFAESDYHVFLITESGVFKQEILTPHPDFRNYLMLPFNPSREMYAPSEYAELVVEISAWR